MRSTFVVAVTGCAIAMINGARTWAGPDWADPNTYGTPVNLGSPVNTSGAEFQLTLSGDELTLIFAAGWTLWGPPRPGSGATIDLWVTTRASTSEPWAEPVRMSTAINREDMHDTAPSLSGDSLELYFTRIEGLAVGSVHSIWVTTRSGPDGPWTTAQKLPSRINNSSTVLCPGLSPDGLSLYYISSAGGGSLFSSTRATRSAEWGVPVKQYSSSGITPAALWWPCISADGQSLLFTDWHGFSDFELWVATRNTPAGNTWPSFIRLPAPMNAPAPVGAAAMNGATWLSPDGTMLYFTSNRAGELGNLDLWQVPILAPADFDRDRDVDGDDLTVFVACAGGPSVPYDPAALPPGCAVTPTGPIIPPDFDKDGDVDQDDFGVFQRCYSGTGQPAKPGCAD